MEQIARKFCGAGYLRYRAVQPARRVMQKIPQTNAIAQFSRSEKFCNYSAPLKKSCFFRLFSCISKQQHDAADRSMDGTMARNYNRDLYRHLEETLARCDALERKFEAYKQKTEQELFECHARIAELEATVAKKDEEIALLKADNERLKRIMNNNSSNSSQPPSRDQKPTKPANTYNGRTKTGRKPGGQPGHEGKTLTREAVEALIESDECLHEIENSGNPVGDYIVRYILDLRLKTVVRELRFYPDADGKSTLPPELKSVVTYGNDAKALAIALNHVGNVPLKRTCELISALSNEFINLSPGSLCQHAQVLADASSNFIEEIQTNLLNAVVLCTDSTAITVNGVQEHIRNFSTPENVLYYPMKTKSIEEMKGTILSKFAGILIHDHETALYHFGTDHAECNAHILRYLRKNTEEASNNWSEEMGALLVEMNNHKKSLVSCHSGGILPKELDRYSARYDELLKQAKEQNKRTLGSIAKSDELSLIRRLETYKSNHLLFASHPEVPFTNNMSERDLRKCKNRQKVSGGFRKDLGKSVYCTLFSVIETCRRRGISFLDHFRQVFRPKFLPC